MREFLGQAAPDNPVEHPVHTVPGPAAHPGLLQAARLSGAPHRGEQHSARPEGAGRRGLQAVHQVQERAGVRGPESGDGPRALRLGGVYVPAGSQGLHQGADNAVHRGTAACA